MFKKFFAKLMGFESVPNQVKSNSNEGVKRLNKDDEIEVDLNDALNALPKVPKEGPGEWKPPVSEKPKEERPAA